MTTEERKGLREREFEKWFEERGFWSTEQELCKRCWEAALAADRREGEQGACKLPSPPREKWHCHVKDCERGYYFMQSCIEHLDTDPWHARIHRIAEESAAPVPVKDAPPRRDRQGQE